MIYNIDSTTIGAIDPDSRSHALAGVTGTLRRLAISVERYNRNRRDYRYLQQLPDYLLDDIALTRGDIKYAIGHRLF